MKRLIGRRMIVLYSNGPGLAKIGKGRLNRFPLSVFTDQGDLITWLSPKEVATLLNGGRLSNMYLSNL